MLFRSDFAGAEHPGNKGQAHGGGGVDHGATADRRHGVTESQISHNLQLVGMPEASGTETDPGPVADGMANKSAPVRTIAPAEFDMANPHGGEGFDLA